MVRSFIIAILLTATAATVGVLAANTANIENVRAQEKERSVGCLVSQGQDGFSARYVDPITFEPLETIRIPTTGDPIIERSRNARERGLVRAHCEAMVLDVLGRARAKQLLRLSD